MFGLPTLLLLTLLFQFGVKPSDGYIKFLHDSFLTTCKSKRVARGRNLSHRVADECQKAWNCQSYSIIFYIFELVSFLINHIDLSFLTINILIAFHRPQSSSSSFWEFLRTIKHDEGKYWKLTGGFTKKSPMRFGRWWTMKWEKLKDWYDRRTLFIVNWNDPALPDPTALTTSIMST